MKAWLQEKDTSSPFIGFHLLVKNVLITGTSTSLTKNVK